LGPIDNRHRFHKSCASVPVNCWQTSRHPRYLTSAASPLLGRSREPDISPTAAFQPSCGTIRVEAYPDVRDHFIKGLSFGRDGFLLVVIAISHDIERTTSIWGLSCQDLLFSELRRRLSTASWARCSFRSAVQPLLSSRFDPIRLAPKLSMSLLLEEASFPLQLIGESPAPASFAPDYSS
jgi:hypothetical protein